MIVDLSKIPSTCQASIWSGGHRPWGCRLEEIIRGRAITSLAWGDTPQEAVDEAIRKFTQ